MEVTHTYPDLTVHLSLFHSSIVSGEPQLLEHADLRWITVNEIDQYPFCPADVETCMSSNSGFNPLAVM